jgi:hypothetical protein
MLTSDDGDLRPQEKNQRLRDLWRAGWVQNPAPEPRLHHHETGELNLDHAIGASFDTASAVARIPHPDSMGAGARTDSTARPTIAARKPAKRAMWSRSCEHRDSIPEGAGAVRGPRPDTTAVRPAQHRHITSGGGRQRHHAEAAADASNRSRGRRRCFDDRVHR